MNAGKCTIKSLKRFLLIRLATDRHTHPKRNGPRGSLFGPSARDGRRAEGQSLAGYLAASCGFTDSHLWSSESVDGNGDLQLKRSNTTHHRGTRTHDPESNEPTILATTNDDRRHEHHETPPPRPPPPTRPPTTKEPRKRPLLRQLATLLIPPPGGWRDPL